MKRPVPEAVQKVVKSRFNLQKAQALAKSWEAKKRRAEYAMLARTSLRELIR